MSALGFCAFAPTIVKMVDRQIGIRMTVDSASVTTLVPQATREFDRLGEATDRAAQKGTKNLSQLSVSLRDIVIGSVGLTAVSSAIHGITDAITSLPRAGLDFSKQIEVSQMGMAGILGSMTAINGQQTTFAQGMAISSDMVRKLNDDALRTAATSQELVGVFQALLAPGLAARMTLDQIRQLTVVGTNAVKSIGLSGSQVVQELRDLVAGGITAAGSSLASALGLKDEDIAKAKASSEGLFSFLMSRLQGFQASSDAFGGTFAGALDQLKEAAVRTAADGMKPLIDALKQAIIEGGQMLQTVDAAGNVQLNSTFVEGIRSYAEGAATALSIGKGLVSGLWEHRDAIKALGTAYTLFRLSKWASEAIEAARANSEVAQASRLARVEAVAQAAGNAEVTLTSRQKVAALLAEMEARQATAQAEVADTAARIANLQVTREAIAVSRAEVVTRMEVARGTIAASEASIQHLRTKVAETEATIQAARAAGSQSYALAILREATANQTLAQSVLVESTATLTAAQARHSALMSEMALLGRQQAQVNASVATATAAHAAAEVAATTTTKALTDAKWGASLASRGLGVAVAALGGPIGATILVVSGLVMWIARLKSSAEDARIAVEQINRAEAVAAQGGKPEDRDIAPLRSALEEWKKKRDALLASGEERTTEWIGGTRYVSTVDSLNAGIANMEKRLVGLSEASQRTETNTKGMTLTLQGTEAAWRKANAEVKTAGSIQEEYSKKLQASKSAFAQHSEMLAKTNAAPSAIAAATKEQAAVEKALATERDKQLKSLNADGVRQAGLGIDAQVEAIKQGYKLQALQTTDGIDAVDSLRKQDLISEYSLIQRKRDLRVEDLKNQETALQRELGLMRGKKDSQKEQAALQGQIRDVQQESRNVQAKAGRDLVELLVQPQVEYVRNLRQGTDAITQQAEAQEAQNAVHGRAKTAINDLTIAQLERSRADFEAADNAIPGYVGALDKRIEAEKRLRLAVAKDEGLDIVDKIKQKQKEDAQKTSDGISDVFRQGFANSFLDNGNALASFGKSLKTTVVTSVANAFYDATIKQSVDGFAGWLTSSLRNALSGSSSGASSSLLTSVLGSVSGGLSGTTAATVANAIGGSDSLGTMINLMGLAGVKSAKGNVFSGASGLDQHVNTVVDRPTLFRYAKGGSFGEMGEAGAEGIMPLKRDAQGRLGVINTGSNGGGGSIVFAPVTNLNVDSRSDRAAVMADSYRLITANNKAQMESFKRMKLVPQT